jgi:electron transfer flavoprotein alpha subunit
LEGHSIWVIAEHDGLRLRDCTLEAICAARPLADQQQEPLEVALLGADTGLLARESAKYDVDVIHRVEHPLLAHYTIDTYVSTLVQILSEPEPYAVLMGASLRGKDLAPTLASRLGWSVLTGCVSLGLRSDGLQLIRPSHQGNIHEVYLFPRQGRIVVSLLPGAIGASEPEHSRVPKLLFHHPQLAPENVRTKILDFTAVDPRTLPLSQAEMVVAGGRGVNGREGWRIIDGLADALGAVVGATRGATDLGYVPTELMIGQTGETIRPRLYIAAGLSGAIQHLAGVHAETTVAVNTDSSAPVMNQSTLAVVGDLHSILALLTERVRRYKAGKVGLLHGGSA